VSQAVDDDATISSHLRFWGKNEWLHLTNSVLGLRYDGRWLYEFGRPIVLVISFKFSLVLPVEVLKMYKTMLPLRINVDTHLHSF